MSHLVKPLSYRLGKTQAWYNNVVFSNKNSLVNSNLTFSKGLEKLARLLLKRKRIYIVKGNIVDVVNGKVMYNLLFLPRIKTKPRESNLGAFVRRSLYKPFNWGDQILLAKDYVHLRKEKSAKMRRRFKPKRVNRWLTKRMFRGAHKIIWKKNINPHLALHTSKGYTRSKVLSGLVGASLLSQKTLTCNLMSNISKSKLRFTMKKLHRLHDTHLNWRQKWNYDRLRHRRFNSRKFSKLLSKKIYSPVYVDATNLFSYLSSKKTINYKNHQNHFWNFRYRRYRFQYKNYYDIVNSFLVMGLMDNSEEFLLSILKITLPLILKIRKFFRFLENVIKYMPELEDKFSVFKINITGKLAGGTKRTKFHSIGFGVLPVQTLNVIVNNNFMAYTHIYGEFGLRLITCKNLKFLSPVSLR